MPIDLRSGIVRILADGKATAGVGFVVSEHGLIATCSHVIQDEGSQHRKEPRPKSVWVEFLATGERWEAQIDAESWRDRNQGDIAILQLLDELPTGVEVLPLGAAADAHGHLFRTRGFRGGNERAGAGEILELVPVEDGQQMLQLRSQEVTQGFSGAPVWDRSLDCVVGMISDIALVDEYGRHQDTAFASATESLVKACSRLRIRSQDLRLKKAEAANSGSYLRILTGGSDSSAAEKSSASEKSNDPITPHTRKEAFGKLCRWLAENKAVHEMFGPESAAARSNPMSGALERWETRKREIIIPNNRRICDLIESSCDLLNRDQYLVYLKFREHAEAFAENADNRIDRQASPRFPSEFRSMIELELNKEWGDG